MYFPTEDRSLGEKFKNVLMSRTKSQLVELEVPHFAFVTSSLFNY